MKKVAGPRLVIAWNTVVGPFSLVSAEDVQRFVIIDKGGDEQIQFAVIVIIKPHCAGGPAGGSDSSLISNISESSVSIIMVENIATITRDVEIYPAIAVIIRCGHSHPKGSPGDSGFAGHVCERAVVVVVVKGIL